MAMLAPLALRVLIDHAITKDNSKAKSRHSKAEALANCEKLLVLLGEDDETMAEFLVRRGY